MARKILLADDSVTAQNMGRKILADAGYEVITVNNGSAALKKIAELKPDLVILDVYMPGYSGLEVCQRLKESQDSSRIPVLLTVGKLEPFKPEEAQRVRAEGYIVKPFEASELLSALSKLEDKVVPRAEPSKPGRFARAIAAQEGSGRGKGSDADSEDNGWKTRIGFPHKKTEAEEKEADDSSIYNPINRDLRTVVETPAEMAAEKAVEVAAAKELKAHPIKAAEPSVAVAALVPPGLPKDVTPEEVAAIAAAAAQIQMLGAVLKDELGAAGVDGASAQDHAQEKRKREGLSPEKLSSEPQAEAAADPALTEVVSQSAPESEIAGEAGAPSASHRRRWDDAPGEAQDVPVTMASAPSPAVTASEAPPRWTAVAVALETNETAISLEAEMQKAYAAFVAEETSARENASSISESATETPIAAMSTAQSAPNPEHATSPVSAGEPISATLPEDATVVSSTTEPADIPQPNSPAAEVASLELDAGTARVPVEPQLAEAPSVEAPSVEMQAVEMQDTQHDLTPEQQAPAEQAAALDSVSVEPGLAHAVPEVVSAAPEIATPENSAVQGAADSPATQELSPVESASVEAAAANDVRPITSADNQTGAENAENYQEDSEVVKTTAAAWASWRQIRDTGHAPSGELARPEFEIAGTPPSEPAAMAVAAGAEQGLHETPAPSTENSSDIASIVDSVLADLRPKLMAEISRKMSEKK